MSRVEPETSHVRLQNVKFLAEGDLSLYADLCTRVQALQTPDEKIEIPDPNGAGAWSATYRIYKALKRRQEAEANKALEFVTNNAATELQWNQFITERAQLLEYLRRESVDRETREFVGLHDADLVDPTVQDDERFLGCRHPDWRGMADRLSTAFWKLRNLTIAQRMNIPNIMETRRLVEAVNSIGEKLKTFEDKLEWLDGRLAAVESKAIDRTNKH